MVAILVIEDDHLLREALHEGLHRLGFEVRAAATMEDARACLQARRFDVVLSDIQMTGSAGAVVAAVRRFHHDTPVVLMTGYDAPGERGRAQESGAVDYLVKPFTLAQLSSAIGRVLGRG